MSEDPRNEAVERNVEKLIKCFYGDSLTASERRIQEQQALHKFRHHRHLSTSGHGVRRNVIFIINRFYDEDLDNIARALRTLTSAIIENPGWKNHYEVDIQYSIVGFLFNLTHMPVQNVRRDVAGMEQRLLAICDALSKGENVPPKVQETDPNLVALLSEDFIKRESENFDSDDSLSPWSSDASDTDDCSSSDLALLSPASTSSENMQLVRVTALKCYSSFTSLEDIRTSQSSRYRFSELPALEPPNEQTYYTANGFNSNHLPTAVHSNWWLENINLYAKTANSNAITNFAITYVQHLNRQSRSDVRLRLPKTICERNLVREIILMFFAPVSCCFFQVEPEHNRNRISVRKNVSISSVSSGTLKAVLEDEVLPAMEAMQQLRKIINDNTLCTGYEVTTGTLGEFALALRDLVQPIKDRLIDFERRFLDKGDKSSTSLITFVVHMKKYFKRLLLIEWLAKPAIIDGPPHLRSAYLLSHLFKHTNYIYPHQKLATALLFASVRRYCNIMDNWWQYADFKDSSREYIVECLVETTDDFGQRIVERLPPSDANADADADDPHREIIKELRGCRLYQLLLEHARQMGETQNLLASVNLLGDLVLSSNLDSVYIDLTKQLFDELNCEINSDPLATSDATMEEYNKQVLQTASSLDNPELADIFTYHIREAQEKKEQEQQLKKTKPTAEVCDVLNALKRSGVIQRANVVPRMLIKVLQERYTIANVYVMRWYREELKLTNHLRLLRHLLLLEADYLLYPFYTGLFEQIEKYDEWARCSLLSLELHDLLEPHYGSIANQLEVNILSKVRAKSNKVFDALDAIEIAYNMPPPLQSIITKTQMLQYNSIFRFVVKVKWAAWKLENMRFLRRLRNDPLAPLDLLGLTLRRLEILRFWLIAMVNSFHSHLCTHVMQMLGSQFVEKISTAKDIQDLRKMHDAYIQMLCKHCLLTPEFDELRSVLDQIFHLIYVLDREWTNCPRFLNDSNALSVDLSGSISDDDKVSFHNDLEYLALNQIDQIENTYIRLHRLLADKLTFLIYKDNHKFLKALEVTITVNVPY